MYTILHRLLYISLALSTLIITGCQETRLANQPYPGQQPIVTQKLAPADQKQSVMELQPQTQIERKVQIALLLPLSGSKAKLGQAMVQAAQMSLFENSGDDSEMSIYDTKGIPSEAELAALKALREGAQLIIGPLFSNEAQSVAIHASRNRVPVLTFSNNQQIAGNDVYVLGFAPSEQIKRIIDVAFANNIRRIGALLPDTAYGNILHQELINQAKSRGMHLPVIATYKPGKTDLGKQAEEIKRAHLEGLLIPAGGQELQQVASALLYHDVDLASLKLLGTGQWDTPEIIHNRTVIGGWFVASPPEQRYGFERRFQSQFGHTPPRLATLAYDAVSLAALLTRSGSPHPFTFASLTQPRGFSGIDGVFRLRPNGTVERSLSVLEVSETGLRVISPAPTGF